MTIASYVSILQVVLYVHRMPSQTSVKPSGARSEGVLQSMAKATGEMVKRKDPKAGHQRKGEASDVQCSKVCYPCWVWVRIGWGITLITHQNAHLLHTSTDWFCHPCVYVQVQQNLKAVFLAYPATSVPDSGDNSSTSEQSTSRYVHMYMQ